MSPLSSETCTVRDIVTTQLCPPLVRVGPRCRIETLHRRDTVSIVATQLAGILILTDTLWQHFQVEPVCPE